MQRALITGVYSGLCFPDQQSLSLEPLQIHLPSKLAGWLANYRYNSFETIEGHGAVTWLPIHFSSGSHPSPGKLCFNA